MSALKENDSARRSLRCIVGVTVQIFTKSNTNQRPVCVSVGVGRLGTTSTTKFAFCFFLLQFFPQFFCIKQDNSTLTQQPLQHLNAKYNGLKVMVPKLYGVNEPQTQAIITGTFPPLLCTCHPSIIIIHFMHIRLFINSFKTPLELL